MTRSEGLGHEPAVRRVTRHLAHQKQRRVTQLHRGAGLDGERGNLLRRDLRHELADATGDGDAVLVELVSQSMQARTLRRSACSGVTATAGAPSWVRGLRQVAQLQYIQLHHAPPL
jgi:hypothetical protein